MPLKKHIVFNYISILNIESSATLNDSTYFLLTIKSIESSSKGLRRTQY